MTVSEILIISILAASVFANVCYVIFNKRLGKYTMRWDLFRWISAYQLFADTPRHFELSYRGELKNGDLTEWRAVPLKIERRWYHPILFPEKLVSDNIYSFVDDLVRFTESGKDLDAVSRSFHCKTVFEFICRSQADEGTIARQFKVNESGGHLSNEPTRQVFVSGFSECTLR